MTKTINHISVNDILWIQFKSHLISFGCKGLPEGTHFTIGFDDRSPDINLHVTKNVIEEKDKPQIKIVVINKKFLDEDPKYLTRVLFNKILQPLDISKLKTQYNYDLGFIPFDILLNPEVSSLAEQHFIENFKDISKVRKKNRLKVEGDVENRLESFATSKFIQQTLLDNIVEFPNEFEKFVESGIIITEDNTFQVIRIDERWFTIRTDITPIDILGSFVNPQFAKQIISKAKRALVAIKYAQKYSDTEHLSKPIRLVMQPSKDSSN